MTQLSHQLQLLFLEFSKLFFQDTQVNKVTIEKHPNLPLAPSTHLRARNLVYASDGNQSLRGSRISNLEFSTTTLTCRGHCQLMYQACGSLCAAR
eukprot:6018716-Amphidinium_carterae.2